jgi:methylenetetrahydrofolate dehydrogenase (NADP+)/methenyltetrahydrofolate cyclohydrolase
VSARVIDGKAVAAELRSRLADEVRAYVDAHGEPPGLATVLVGEDAASMVYVGSKHKACESIGMRSFDVRLSAESTEAEVRATVERLNADPQVSGIIVQLPLPGHLDGVAMTGLVDVSKDVDGLTPMSSGLLALGLPGLRPCTPSGVMLLLESAAAELEGAKAVVVGRSNLFGKPMAQLLLGANATVTICHSRTRDLPAVCAEADVLIAAIGRPEMVKGDWVKEGAVVIDVGVNRREDGTLVGDVDHAAAAERASGITPVPGGVGPMTIACLLRNTVLAATGAVGD